MSDEASKAANGLGYRLVATAAAALLLIMGAHWAFAQNDDPSAPITPRAETTQPQVPSPELEPGELPDLEAAESRSEPDAAPAVTAEPEPAPPARQQAAPSRQPARSGPAAIAVTDPPLPRPRPNADAAPLDPADSAMSGDPADGAPVSAGGEENAIGMTMPEGAGPIDPDHPAFTMEGIDLSPAPGLELDEAEPDVRIGPQESFPLSVVARLTDDSGRLADGLVWRVFRSIPTSDGTFELIEESDLAAPSFVLPADDYIVHVAYGRANTARRISLRAGPAREEITLNAGGLRLLGVDGEDRPIADRSLSVSVFSSEQDEYGQRRLIVEQATPGHIIRLNPGAYHIVSRYGDANAVVRADVRVQPGQLTDARIHHSAAAVTLKLVNEPGGEALANTNWSILSPGGDVVKETFGAFPTHVLADGPYSVVARHEGRLYNRDFTVEPGVDTEVELIAQ